MNYQRNFRGRGFGYGNTNFGRGRRNQGFGQGYVQGRGRVNTYLPNFRTGNRMPIRFTNNKRNNKNRNKQQNNNLPFFKNVQFKQGMKVRSRDTQSASAKFKFTLGIAQCYAGSTFVIAMHPLFLNQQVLNMAVNYTNYKINRVTIKTIPNVPVNDGTALAMGYTTHCTALTHDVTAHYGKILALNGASGMAHTSLTYSVPISDTFHPIMPVVPSDIPFTIFITSQDSAIDLSLKIRVSIILDISFRTAYTSDEMDLTLGKNDSIITSGAGGVECDIAIPTSFGFVLSSTAPNIDCGELLMSPAFLVKETVYNTPLFHNTVMTRPAYDANDYGDIYWTRRELF